MTKIVISKYSDGEQIFESDINGYAIHNERLQVQLAGGYKQNSIQLNVLYKVAISSDEDESIAIERSVTFLYYSYNCGTTTIKDEEGNTQTSMCVLDNSLLFSILG